MQKYEEVDV